MSILEEQPPGTIVGFLHAIDEDINENSAIDYMIIDGNQENLFQIERMENSSGVIRSLTKFDRETVSSFLLTVKCFKYGMPHAQIPYKSYNRKDLSNIEVNVRITDIDDHLPDFVEKNPSFGVRLNVPIDFSLIIVKAIDVDPDAKPLFYQISNVTFVPQFYKRDNNTNENVKDFFVINNITAELRTAKSLSDYVDGYFEITVQVNSIDAPKRVRYNQVKVFVIRDKSLLRFIFDKPPAEVKEFVDEFADAVQARLKSSELELNVLDTKALTRLDQKLDFSATG